MLVAVRASGAPITASMIARTRSGELANCPLESPASCWRSVSDSSSLPALGAGERLAAVLDAMARGDHREDGRLRQACPRRAYTAPVRAFADRVLLAFEAASLAAVNLRALCARLDTLRWAAASASGLAPLHRIGAELAFVEGVKHGCALGDGGSDPVPFGPCGEGLDAPAAEAVRAVDNSVALLPTLFAEAEAAVARELAVQGAGLGRFARQRVGVTARTLLAARGMPKVALQAEAWPARHPGVVAYVGRVAEHAALLAAGWDERFRPEAEGD